MAPLQTHELRIEVQPEDIRGAHVNFGRYFDYINRAFTGWYALMHVGPGESPGYSFPTVHVEYDFLGEVAYPGAVLVKLRVARVGRASMDHAIEVHDVSPGLEPRLVGRGKAVHAWLNRTTGKSEAWAASVLAKCWDADG